MTGTVKQTLADVWAAYQSLTVARGKRDSLDLDLPERRVILGADGKVASIAIASGGIHEADRGVHGAGHVAAAEALEKAKTP